MSPRIQVSSKRKSTSTTSVAEETPRFEQDDDFPTSSEEEEESHAASRASQGRPAASASRILARVMGANLKSPPPAAVATPTRAAATTASHGSSSRARAVHSPQVQAARSTNSALSIQNVAIANHVSPPAVAQMPVASPQAMHPPSPFKMQA